MVLLNTLFWPKLGFCEQIPGAKLVPFGREGRDLGTVTVGFWTGFQKGAKKCSRKPKLICSFWASFGKKRFKITLLW